MFSQPNTPTDSLCAGIAVCPPGGGRLCRHRRAQAEVYYVISGSGVVSIDGREYAVEAGSSVFIPEDAEHGISNLGGPGEELRFFYVFPTGGFADVVYRFSEGG